MNVAASASSTASGIAVEPYSAAALWTGARADHAVHEDAIRERDRHRAHSVELFMWQCSIHMHDFLSILSSERAPAADRQSSAIDELHRSRQLDGYSTPIERTNDQDRQRALRMVLDYVRPVNELT